MELLILTYHYIDNPDKYKAGIYPVSPEKLKENLETISKTHSFISEGDLIDALNGKNLPEKSALVTFDDGLRCQFEHAVPVLRDMGVPATFFITTQQYTDNIGASVHKIHYLLSETSPAELLAALEGEYENLKGVKLDWGLVNKEKIKKWYIYDDEDARNFKYLLNHEFDPSLAEKITDKIFRKFYKGEESKFCEDLYMSKKQLINLNEDTLFSIGLHTHSHIDISRCGTEFVLADISKNHKILKEEVGVNNINAISYPYGISGERSREKIINFVSTIGIKYGVSTEKGINKNLENRFTLKRINPNDLDNYLK